MNPARRSGTAVTTVVLAIAAACATNPVTGKRELMLVSEEQEIALGKEADASAVRSFGTYGAPALQQYVAGLGRSLARDSERPDLPWTFRVVDDAAVNAFAIPGGYVYVTRGLLTHLTSEAELAMVLGHEIGHVTARHSASQISKQQLATLGLGLGMVAVPELQRFGAFGQAGLGLLFLKFGRDDERQADDLGLRYSGRLGYDPQQCARAMEMLDLLSQQSDGGRMPGWLSTHPDPGDRYERLLSAIQQQNLGGQKVDREGYLRRIDGLVFGEDPREGFFREGVFYHPELRFRLELPAGFRTQNTKQAVIAASPEGDAVVQLSMAQGSSAEAAAREFLRTSNAEADGLRRTELNGLAAMAGEFHAVSGQTRVSGASAFVEHGGRVYQILGYTAQDDWARHERRLGQAVSSFAPLAERWALAVQPRKLQIVKPEREMSVPEFAQRYPSTVSDATIALINHLQPDGTIAAGRLAKRVVGGQGLEPERDARQD